MTSILKVDTIQTAAGGTPTAADLGLNVTGSVLQVVSATKSDFFTTASTTYVDITGLTVSITPSSTSSKILVVANLFLGQSSNNGFTLGQLVRDTTVLGNNTSGTNGYSAFATSNSLTGSNPGRGMCHSGITYLDSPSTTSSVSYKLQARAGTGGTGYVNRWGLNADAASTSSITVMEIAG